MGRPLEGRKPYLFSRFYPSMARVAKVVKISAQELDRVKTNRNGVVGLPRKSLEEKAKALADQGEWTSFIDILALLVFETILFPNVDRLMGLVAINAFLAYHHSKESPIVAILADAYDTFDLRCEKSSTRIICCTPALYVWLLSHVLHHEGRPVCPLQGHRMCAKKGKTNWEELLASMVGVSYPNFVWGPSFTNVLILASRIELINTNYRAICRVLWRFERECAKYLNGGQKGHFWGIFQPLSHIDNFIMK